MSINKLESSTQTPSKFPIAVWILILCGVLFSPLSSTIISYDGDVAHHALLGKIIISDLNIPTIEPTAYTAPDKVFIAHEWLAEVVYGGLDMLIGPSGLAFLAALLFGACLYFIALILERNLTPSIYTVFIIPIIFFLLRIHFVARPHLFTWLLFILTYLVIDSFRSGLFSFRSLSIRLAIIFIAWANIHGSFLFGLFSLFLLLAFPLLIPSRQKDYLSIKQLLFLFFLLTLCTLFNPYGAKLHYHVITFLLQGNDIRKYISEFGGASLDTIWYIVATLFTLFLVAFGLRKGNQRFAEDYLLIAALILLSFYSPRMSSYLFLLLPLVAFKSHSFNINRKYYLLTSFVIIAVSCTWLIAIKAFPTFKITFDESLQPVKGVEFIKSQGHTTNKIFNTYEWGGFLAYMLYPNQKVFIHGLNDHYGIELFNKYNQVIGELDKSDSILKALDVKRVIFPINTPLTNSLLDLPNWKAVYRDATCVILDRKD